jgi:hypothetical protein
MNRPKFFFLGIILIFVVLLAATSHSTASVDPSVGVADTTVGAPTGEAGDGVVAQPDCYRTKTPTPTSTSTATATPRPSTRFYLPVVYK